MLKTEDDYWQHWIATKDVLAMCIYEFNLKPDEYPSESQCEIIRKVLFQESDQVIYLAPTQYGKSHAMGYLANLFLLFNKNKKVRVIAPQWSQTNKIMQVSSDMQAKSQTLKTISHTFHKSKDDGDNETSKKRKTFKNGCEISTLGVQGEGKGAMGEGGDLLIVDEFGLMEAETYRKRISRMLGGATKSQIICLVNPWDSSSIAYDLKNDLDWEVYYVNWQTAVKEGRLLQSFVDKQRRTLTPLEFRVLYDAKFPKTATDTLMTQEEVMCAVKREVGITGNPHVEIGVDVARYGDDSTVIACRMGMKCWYIEEHQKEGTMETSGRVSLLINKYISEGYYVIVNVDDTGVGGGVTDRLFEMHGEVAQINGIINNSTSFDTRFADRITELWFWIKEHIETLDLPKNNRIIKEFSKRRYKFTSKGRLKLESKDEMKKRGLKSPDVADAVVNAFASETDTGMQSIGGFV